MSLEIQPLKGLLKESIQPFIIELYVKKESDLLFIQNFFWNLQKRAKKKIKEQKGWGKRKLKQTRKEGRKGGRKKAIKKKRREE